MSTVLFFCNLVPDKEGAFETFLAELGRRLTAEGHALHLALAGRPIDSVAKRFADAGVGWTVIEGWGHTERDIRPWRLFQGGRAIVKERRPTIVAFHFCNELPAAALVVWARCGNMGVSRWFWHQHQEMAPPRNRLAARLSKMRLLALSGVYAVALYDGAAPPLLARGFRRDRVAVIPNGVPGPRVDPATAQRLRDSFGVSHGLLVVNIGSLIPRKRLDVTLQAFAAARRNVGAPARLAIVGTGPEEQRLRTMAQELGLADAVIFAGRRDDVPAVLCAADVVVLSSDREACPLVILEAMAAGRPVVATRAGAVSELVVDGETGYVVDCGASNALAESLRRLLTDAALRAATGAAARKRWADLYAVDNCINRHVELWSRQRSFQRAMPK